MDILFNSLKDPNKLPNSDIYLDRNSETTNKNLLYLRVLCCDFSYYYLMYIKCSNWYMEIVMYKYLIYSGDFTFNGNNLVYSNSSYILKREEFNLMEFYKPNILYCIGVESMLVPELGNHIDIRTKSYNNIIYSIYITCSIHGIMILILFDSYGDILAIYNRCAKDKPVNTPNNSNGMLNYLRSLDYKFPKSIYESNPDNVKYL